MTPLFVDGSYGEGGGQIVRTAVSLAAITGRAIEIDGVRARRRKPGLAAQHLAAIRAAAGLCGAALEGDAIGSTHLRFAPRGPGAADVTSSMSARFALAAAPARRPWCSRPYCSR